MDQTESLENNTHKAINRRGLWSRKRETKTTTIAMFSSKSAWLFFMGISCFVKREDVVIQS
jgi:hypothetical protein